MHGFRRVALGAAAFIALAATVPAGASVEVEGFPNGSLEGVGKRVLGWTTGYDGAEVSTSEFRSGLQSVNLAKIGAPAEGHLGLVGAYPAPSLTSGVYLKPETYEDYRAVVVPTVALFDAVKSFSFWYKVPVAPTQPIALQPFIYIQKPNQDLDLSQYACLVSAAGPALAKTDGWQQVVLDGSLTVHVGGGLCPGGETTETLASLQEGERFDGYTVWAVFLQTIVGTSRWEGGTPVYVDDLSLTLDL